MVKKNKTIEPIAGTVDNVGAALVNPRTNNSSAFKGLMPIPSENPRTPE